MDNNEVKSAVETFHRSKLRSRQPFLLIFLFPESGNRFSLNKLFWKTFSIIKKSFIKLFSISLLIKGSCFLEIFSIIFFVIGIYVFSKSTNFFISFASWNISLEENVSILSA